MSRSRAESLVEIGGDDQASRENVKGYLTRFESVMNLTAGWKYVFNGL